MERELLETLLQQAWHEETARNSVDRWFKISDKERWSGKPANIELLIRLFGASWYFTRFIFATGMQAIEVIDRDNRPPADRKQILDSLLPSLRHEDVEIRTNQLRTLKNLGMLQILAGYLQGNYSLEQLETALTWLAESTLEVLIDSVCMLPQHSEFPVTVLAMGRMAGYEMTFGSDLDLIFIYDEKNHELHDRLGRTIRLLLRTIAQPAAAGTLYEVDMRLRPHGNSGLLVTSYRSFLEYHDSERDIWERQMMTRCRPVLIGSERVEPVLRHVMHSVYSQYPVDKLKHEIREMRTRVQKELGSPKGRYEIKRGYGGIMDIDFVSHCFQLLHGHRYPELQTCSTRKALHELASLQLIGADVCEGLLTGYDYLKRVEMCLRLFDLKSVDSFRTFGEDNRPLSRAMGHGDDIQAFLDEYESVTRSVREHFGRLLS